MLTEDLDLYNSTWLPKVEAYRAKTGATLKGLVPEVDVAEDTLDVTTVPNSYLSKEELEITTSTATKLVEDIAAGKLTSEEVVRAFAKRAQIAHQVVNCCAELLFDEAIIRAKELDSYFKSTGKTVGPLHGLPISTKEHIATKGHITHASYAAWVEHEEPEDAITLQILKAAGAVHFARTNEPLSLMVGETENNIHGRTVNPYNRKLTCGGSSGGEGALIGMRGTPIGIGTDIGGSIRIPAAFCGGYGIKMTSLRMSLVGSILPGPGQETIICTMAPLTNSPLDTELYLKAYLGAKPWELDASLVPLPWREPDLSEKFTIGIMYDDGVVKTLPPITRGIKYAEDKLKRAGFTVVPFPPIGTTEIPKMAYASWFADGGKAQLEVIGKSGEPYIIPLKKAKAAFTGQSIDAAAVWEINDARDKLRQVYKAQMKSLGVDFVLCPMYPGPAAPIHEMLYGTYTIMWNVLDMPAMVFPTGLKADPEIDIKDPEYSPISPPDASEYERYNPETVKGAPIPLQLVGPRYMDEWVVRAVQKIAPVVQG
ncbi:hypothetical protein CANCADRAFT_46226 [Tortispora caseinolytica NRRL Y-17796]|uniref:amidase n=1 Tax=Tortispora caseinolytica NRRL Y-17796 TaxID=767744 RepID=A0A1E4TDJ1_9ASCO|nr:hypothetical protein CANCADRAFT_46226 [Tortispora caseinolytica NRRL Y-17796]